MASHEHWLPRLIASRTNTTPPACKFLQGHILDHIVNGRIHAEIHPFRSEDGGAKSLRFCYSDPPLQQMPIRDKEMGPLIRRVFVPEEGEIWAKPDVTQQEFRILVDFAEQHELPGAREAGDAYRNNPKADFHQVVADMTGLDRDRRRPINFTRSTAAACRGCDDDRQVAGRSARRSMAQYDAKLPFVSKLSRIYQNQAERTGDHHALWRRGAALEQIRGAR